VGLSAAVPVIGLLAVVSTAAMPGPPSGPLPTSTASTTTTTAAPTTTAEPGLEVGGESGASVIRRGDQLEVTLATDVLFAFGSVTLEPPAVERLTELAPRLARSARLGVVAIVGHTDSIGSEAANQVLSEARAQAVKDVIAAARPDLQFQVSGKGASAPVAPNEIDGRDNPEGRARNRRVEITFAAP